MQLTLFPQESKQKMTVHHMIPLSLLGFDWEENRILLTDKEHKELHENLDVKYELIRKYRKKTNHFCLRPNQALVDETIHIQRKFFSNFGSLSNSVQQKHVDKMEELCRKTKREFRVSVSRPIVSGNLENQFFIWLKHFHTILRQVVA